MAYKHRKYCINLGATARSNNTIVVIHICGGGSWWKGVLCETATWRNNNCNKLWQQIPKQFLLLFCWICCCLSTALYCAVRDGFSFVACSGVLRNWKTKNMEMLQEIQFICLTVHGWKVVTRRGDGACCTLKCGKAHNTTRWTEWLRVLAQIRKFRMNWLKCGKICKLWQSACIT